MITFIWVVAALAFLTFMWVVFIPFVRTKILFWISARKVRKISKRVAKRDEEAGKELGQLADLLQELSKHVKL